MCLALPLKHVISILKLISSDDNVSLKSPVFRAAEVLSNICTDSSTHYVLHVVSTDGSNFFKLWIV